MDPSAHNSAIGLLRQEGEAVDAYLRDVLKRQVNAPKRLIESMEYSLMAGGKRLRRNALGEIFFNGGSLPQKF